MNGRVLRTALLTLVTLGAALHLSLVFLTNINWDEFRYLADVHQLHAGTLTAPLQTLHVHLFRWLPGVRGDEVDQVIAARLTYFLLLLGSCTLLFLIARRFMSVVAALFVVLCCLAWAEIIRHGTAFRYDGLAVFLLLAALALLLRRRTVRSAAAAGVLAAVALLVTIKSVLFVPTLVVALLLRRRPDGEPDADTDQRWRGDGQWRVVATDFAIFGACFVVAAAVLYALHRLSLGDAQVRDPATMVRSAGARTIRLDRLVPSWPYLRASLSANVVIWLLLLDGALLTACRALRGSASRDALQRRDALILLALLLPLLSLVFYRNGFPYFYVFLMPAALVLCGLRIDTLTAPGADERTRMVPALFVTLVALSFTAHALRRSYDGIAVQRRVVAAVHEIFPEPVTYIDRNSMIASFPKAGFFMSTWGFERYFERGSPVFEEILRTRAPKFVLANHPALILDASVPMPVVRARYALLEADYRLLQRHYVPHWGPIFVAGRRVPLPAATPVRLVMLIPGPYTLEAAVPVIIGDLTVSPGDVIMLDAADYVVRSAAGQVITLRWGSRLPRPADPPPTGLLYEPLSN